MHTIHCVCSPCHLRRWDRLQRGFPEGRLWRRGGWLHAEQGQPQPGCNLSFRLITITSPWCFCHLSLRFLSPSLGLLSWGHMRSLSYAHVWRVPQSYLFKAFMWCDEDSAVFNHSHRPWKDFLLFLSFLSYHLSAYPYVCHCQCCYTTITMVIIITALSWGDPARLVGH